jgi:transposase
MKMARRNRDVERIKAQAEEWVEQTRQGFAEARAKLDAELEDARSALEAERASRAGLERALEGERRERAELQRRLDEKSAKEAKRAPRDGKATGARGTGRVEKWKAVRKLAAEGLSQREIAHRLGINRRTVARLVAAETPPRYRRDPQGSMLDPLDPVMLSVLRDKPGISAAAMTEILREHGYRGSVDLVRRRLRAKRPPSGRA